MAQALEDLLDKGRSILAAIGDLAGTRSVSSLEVSYERLVVEPRETLRDVFDFLHEAWDLALEEADRARSSHPPPLPTQLSEA